MVTDHDHHHHHHHHQRTGSYGSSSSSSGSSSSVINPSAIDSNPSIETDKGHVETPRSHLMDKTQSTAEYMSGNHHPHQMPEPLSGLRHLRRISFDDIDISNSHHNIERRGSIPMIGSLVYFKNTNHNNHTSHHRRGESVPLPKLKFETTCDSKESLDHRPSDKNSTVSNNSDSETVLSTDSEGSRSDDHYNEHHYKLFRNFSLPEISLHGNVSPQGDEFNAINLKIKSHLKRNHEKFNKFLNDEIKKSHFNNIHFHIPGLDPDLSSSDVSSTEASHTNSPTGPKANSSSASPISSQLQSRSNSMSKLNQSPKYSNDIEPQHGNSRHRRRLTCAMIFTRPKVVEI